MVVCIGRHQFRLSLQFMLTIVIFCCSLENLCHEMTGLKQEFELTDHGEVHHILRMLKKGEHPWHVSQAKFTDGVLNQFGIESSKPVAMPLEVKIENCGDPHGDIKQYQAFLGSLIYFMTASRPDLFEAFSVSWLAQSMCSSSAAHWSACKRIL